MEKASPQEHPPFPKESVPGNRHTFRCNELEVDVYRLIDLTEQIPESEIAVEDFAEELLDECWKDAEGKSLSPQNIIEAYNALGNADAVIAAHPEWTEHVKKIENADYSHPILIFESHIIDGMHRFAKAVLQKKIAITAKILEEIPPESIIKIHKPEEE